MKLSKQKITFPKIVIAIIATFFFSIVISNLIAPATTTPTNFKTLNLPNHPITFTAKNENPFVHAKGRQLVIGLTQKPFQLRGVNFNNRFWENSPSKIINSKHHAEIDYTRVKEIGFNTIRFALNYDTVNSPEGWDWLKQNIEWAKEQELYLILDLHLPPGGYQAGTNEGRQLWTNESNQQKLIEIWKKIATEYQDEKFIAAYDLLNEPTPIEPNQWEKLANQLTTEIRKIDPHHLIIIEQTYDGSHSIPFVQDNNIAYDSHFYSPIYYTHYDTGRNTSHDQERFKYYDNDETENDRSFDIKYLHQKIAKFTQLSKARNAPINIGEFGTSIAMHTEKRGGLKYLDDLIDIFEANNFSYQLWDYHSNNFGLYNSNNFPAPENAHTELIELFKKELQQH